MTELEESYITSRKLRDVLSIVNIYDRITIRVNKKIQITCENKDEIDAKYLDCEVDCIGTTVRCETSCLLIDIWE